MSAPMVYEWTGEAMQPLPRFARACNAEFVVGERYQLIIHEERSANSHRHYFASIREAWLNLPEHLQMEHPSTEHLRKAALIKTGFANSRQFVAANRTEALRLANFIRPMDDYSVVLVDGLVVTQWTAQSQDHRSMGKQKFQESKTAVLDYLAALIGTTPAELEKARAS